jgi:hypothetical protein
MKTVALARKEGLEISVASLLKTTLVEVASTTRQSVRDDVAIRSQPPCASLDITKPEEFIRDVISPRIPLENFSVVDVLPTTEFQRLCIRSRWCTYFLLNIPAHLDENSLRRACEATVQKHDILRTVFLPYQDGFVQVILHHIDTPLQTLETDQSLILFAESHCQKDAETPVPLGVPSFQLTLVSSRRDSQNVVILRLNHANYDGVSMPVLYNDIATAYMSKSNAAAPSFSLYMQHRLSQQTAPAFDFWREFLRNASMTQLPGPSLGASNNNKETEIRASREISLPSPPPGITIATLFKAAWSFVLARLTSTQDLVFGQVVSGRNLPMNGAERVVGACVNIVPTRVTIESSWTALDLLYHVRDQHSRTIPFETIDLEEIFEKSTEWEKGTGFGCIAQCQNIDIEPKFELAGVECTSRALAFQTEVTKDFYIVALPVGERLVVEIAASTRMLSAESAESIVGMVCDACLSFASEPDELLSLPSELFGQVQ